MSHTSSINNSSFIRPSASMPSLDFKRDLTAKTVTGKTIQGRSIQQTTAPKLSFVNKVKSAISILFSHLMFQRKVKMVPMSRVENSLSLLRSEFEQKLAEKEAKIISLQQAYDKNHEHISRSLRKILAVSDNLSDLQQRSEAKWLEIEARLEKLEQYFSDSKSMGERTTRAGSTETLSSRDSVESHGVEGAIVPVHHDSYRGVTEQRALMSGAEQLALTAGPEQLALTAGPEQLALTAGPEQLALTAGPEQLALTAGPEQLALTAGPKQLALTAGESLAEQVLGNPYDLLRNSAKQNTMERTLAKENLHRELVEHVKDKNERKLAKENLHRELVEHVKDKNERKLAKENLHQELLARFKDKSSQSPAAQATPQQRPLPPAEKLAAAQVAGKKVMPDKNSTLQDRTDAYATVVEAQRGVKISKQAAKSRKRNTKLANALKKNS